ncbi:hypothetical protein AC626_01785 [Pseudoalteromonas rubra]|uniref:Uncharacterized protein n=2 Tax=Pseudoalteromonas TaxID=53246 RepID=A0A0L0EX22_9GAMM|nr:hypothetical protein AC626_01785 [Pseudoalteromonas rubra]
MKCLMICLWIMSFFCFAGKPMTPSKAYQNALSPEEKSITLEYEALLKKEFFEHLDVLSAEKLELLLKLRDSIISDGATRSQALIDVRIAHEALAVFRFISTGELTGYQRTVLKKLESSISDNKLELSDKRLEKKIDGLREAIEKQKG